FANYTVYALAFQPDGKVVAGGWFDSPGQPVRSLIRLNEDGTLDSSYNPGATAGVSSPGVYGLAAQPDGQLFVGGDFRMLAGQSCTNIGRLNVDGTLDTSFYATRNRIGRLNADGTLDPTFNTTVNSIVRCLALQADGMILVGGDFTTLGTLTRSHIGRLNLDGTVDVTFNPGVGGGTVYGFAVQPDGKILAGGKFSTLGGQPRSRIGRLDNTYPAVQSLTLKDSTLTWLRSGASPEVWRADFDASTNGADWFSLGAGTRVAGGWQATNIALPANATVRARGAVASGRYNASLWFTDVSTGPPAISIPPAGRTNIASTLASFSVLAAGDLPLGYQWRKDGVALNEGGNVVGAHTSTLILSNVFGVDGGAYSVVISNASGTITSLVATLTVFDPFITSQPASAVKNAGTSAAFSVQAAGTSPLSYQWYKGGIGLYGGGNVTGSHSSMLTLSNVLGSDMGGYWVTVSNSLGSVTSAVATLSVTDPFLTSQPVSQTVSPGQTAAFSVAAAGTALGYQWRKGGVPMAGTTGTTLGITNAQRLDAGLFDVVVSNIFGSVTSTAAMLTVNLAATDSLNPGANSTVWALAVQTDGKILVGGSFSVLGSQERFDLGRLNADGTFDATFAPDAVGNQGVFSFAVQPNGRTLVGGGFLTLAGQSQQFYGRLNSDGTLDASFSLGANGSVNCLVPQPDGKTLMSGSFRTLGSQTVNYIARINADGTLDTGFSPGAGGSSYPSVSSMAIQPDGKIIVGGLFTTLGGQTRNYIGRLNADGTLDTSFDPGANGTVFCLAVQPDGRIVVGGTFTTLGGQTRNNMGRLNSDGTLDNTFNPGANDLVSSLALQTDGRILAGGRFTVLGGQASKLLERVNGDVTLDSTFDPVADNSVNMLALQADGKILVGGNFANLGGQARAAIGRLENTDP
ncbi:MAG: immunoglobulin domain-containing protein, partial [Verrucomicrobia bacterium]|nr:immunoglobulin domain-containing protein [Verrucomicrobiota bacterium]